MSSHFLRAVAFFLLAAATVPSQAVTVTLQEGLSNYVGTTDNGMTVNMPTDNDGAVPTWPITNTGALLARFQIFTQDGGPVPNGATITSATLSIHKFTGPDSTFKANRLLKNWNELQSTWQVAATGTPWQTAGAAGSTDIVSSHDGQASVATGVVWLNINVTSGVQAFAAGTPNYGWKISWVSGTTSVKSFYTRNYPNDPTLRPKLTITYTIGSSGLPAPQNLDASVSGSTVNLRWQDVSSDETQFKVERKTGAGGTYGQIGTTGANATQYPDSTVSTNTTYFYRVRAANGTTNGAYSNEVAVTVTTPSNDGGWTLDYKYDAFGNLVQTIAGSVVTTTTYDLRGRKTAVNDPDMGNWTYVYNALGEMKSQTDAKSQTATMAYDLLGRMTSRTEPDLVSTWTYDSCTKGIGKLCQVASDNSYSRTYSYDGFGRNSQISTSFDSTTYDVGYGYDVSGRPSQITYPTGFVAKYVYNAFGHVSQLTDSAGATVYWQANTLTASGQVLNETLGNGLAATWSYDVVGRPLTNVVSDGGGAMQNFSYTWDGVGNLLQRVDAHQSVTENFSYDKLNRLDVSSGPALVTKSFAYDMHGNITYRSDVGTYTYGARPHAVTAVSGTLNATYTYDANGNMQSGNGRTLTYTSFNMPVTMTGNGYTYTYTYGPNHERMRLVHSTLGTFIYVHPNASGDLLYEKETRLDGLVEHKHYLSVRGKAIGAHLTRSDATQETRYFHHDHIGSLTLITNASGAQIERLSYEAFGKRRFPNGTDDPGNTLFGVTTDRGFTSHEHLDEIGLIHMNGRVYDPLLARFMTPDPFVQAPFNLQSYNRYSYVFNNPLRGYDPSGYFSWDDFSDWVEDAWDEVEEFVEDVGNAAEDIIETAETIIETALDNPIQTIAIIAISVATYGAATAYMTAGLAAGSSTAFATVNAFGTASLTWAGGAAAGAASGFAAGFVGSGGDLEAAAKGALGGAIVGGIGAAFGNAGAVQQMAAKTAAGGISAEVQGGNFRDGVYGAIAGSAIASGARYVYQSIVGYPIDTAPGGAAVDKEGSSRPTAGANNVGTAGMVGREGNRWQEGGARSNSLNQIHGINAVAGLHDIMQIRLDDYGLRNSVLNPLGMPVAAFATYMGVIDRVPGPSFYLNPR